MELYSRECLYNTQILTNPKWSCSVFPQKVVVPKCNVCNSESTLSVFAWHMEKYTVRTDSRLHQHTEIFNLNCGIKTMSRSSGKYSSACTAIFIVSRPGDSIYAYVTNTRVLGSCVFTQKTHKLGTLQNICDFRQNELRKIHDVGWKTCCGTADRLFIDRNSAYLGGWIITSSKVRGESCLHFQCERTRIGWVCSLLVCRLFGLIKLPRNGSISQRLHTMFDLNECHLLGCVSFYK